MKVEGDAPNCFATKNLDDRAELWAEAEVVLVVEDLEILEAASKEEAVEEVAVVEEQPIGTSNCQKIY